MKAGRTFNDYFGDMLDACLKACSFVQGMTYQEFVDDEKTQFAVIRALEIIGEASKKIPQETRDQHDMIPWRVIAGMRDKMVHDYMGVNKAVVWRTVNEDIPRLIDQLQEILGFD